MGIYSGDPLVKMSCTDSPHPFGGFKAGPHQFYKPCLIIPCISIMVACSIGKIYTTHKMLEHCNPMRMYIYSKSMIYFSECKDPMWLPNIMSTYYCIGHFRLKSCYVFQGFGFKRNESTLLILWVFLWNLKRFQVVLLVLLSNEFDFFLHFYAIVWENHFVSQKTYFRYKN